MDSLSIRHIPATGDSDDIGQPNTKVFTNDLVHFDRGIVAILVGEDDAYGILSLFTLEEYSVSTEEFEFFHFCGGEGDYGVVIVISVVYDETVRGALFAAQDCVFHVCVFAVASWKESKWREYGRVS